MNPRLAEMVAHARTHSAFYRELYRYLPERVEDPALLPVTTKKELMARERLMGTTPKH